MSRTLSVPPEVRQPQQSSPPFSIATIMLTISASNLRTPGKMPG